MKADKQRYTQGNACRIRAIANDVVQQNRDDQQGKRLEGDELSQRAIKHIANHNISSKLMPFQMEKGDPDNPHLVHEGKYKLLENESLGDHITVPGVSGCAAVKVNVFTGADKEQRLVKSIVFHSDALDKSIQSATEMGEYVRFLDLPKKSVSIFVITNANWGSGIEHSQNVLPNITRILTGADIPYNTKTMSLTYDIGDVVNIDVTGSDEEIMERYQDNVPNEDERPQRELAYKEFLGLRREIAAAKVNHTNKRIKSGRKYKINPNYIEVPRLADYANLKLEERLSVNKRIRRQLDNPAGGCFITTACVEYKGLTNDCQELTLLRDFRDNYLLKKEGGDDLISLYYKIAPHIVRAIANDPECHEIYESLYKIICVCTDNIKGEEFEKTYAIYYMMVSELSEIYFNK